MTRRFGVLSMNVYAYYFLVKHILLLLISTCITVTIFFVTLNAYRIFCHPVVNFEDLGT
jgi:hypothetical protein